MHFLLWQGKKTGANVLERVELDLLESDYLPLYPYFSVNCECRAVGNASARCKLCEFTHLGVNNRVCKVIRIHPPYECLSAVEIQPLHLKLSGIVEVNGLLVQCGQSGREIDLSDDAVVVRYVHHKEVIAGDGAEAHRICRITIAYPMPGTAGMVNEL